MMINILHTMVISILVASMLVSLCIMLIIGILTRYLYDKPKLNKFRQWWSNHVVDMDDKYNN
jgi:hypothetical protein